jgi:putative transcriptional regulator
MTPGQPSTQPIDNQIRRLRFEYGEITQEALANAVGITRQTVIALEAARYAPSLELAMKIAEVFGKKVDEVFFRRAAG